MMRRGQVALYLLMTIVVLAIVAFMNVDIFLVVRTKNRVQNAGDAATLAAARVQGELLNQIGKLNIDHLSAAIAGDSIRCRAIEQEQKRLVLLGPLRALKKANDAAKENGAEPRADFAQLLKEHVETIRTVYSGSVDSDADPYPEPWPGAWVEYASAIEDVISGGLAVGPDNNKYYHEQGGHLLLNPQFYSAIAGRCWCWFRQNDAENELRNYAGWHSWDPIPERRSNVVGNCEIFSLYVESRGGALTAFFSDEEIIALMDKWGDSSRLLTPDDVRNSPEIHNPEAVWFFFNSDAWAEWFRGMHLMVSGHEMQADFPIVGEIKREYNVGGAAAVCRCIMKTPGILKDREVNVVWYAAGRPFGKIADAALGSEPVTAIGNFVLPVFEAVRLVPIDAVPGGCLSTADIDWVHHLRYHLPEYLQNGPGQNGGCSYCQLLQEWEQNSLHQEASLWLDQKSDTCSRGSGPDCCYGGIGH